MVTDSPTRELYCHTVTRAGSRGGWTYWCVARYVAKPRKDGTMTWRRGADITAGYRSPGKASRVAGINNLIPNVRQNVPVTL